MPGLKGDRRKSLGGWLLPAAENRSGLRGRLKGGTLNPMKRRTLVQFSLGILLLLCMSPGISTRGWADEADQCRSDERQREAQNGVVMAQLSSRPPCSQVYPPESSLKEWFDSGPCREAGASACGGPNQCSCQPNERLVFYQCVTRNWNYCESTYGAQLEPRCR
jgi:hypothetical protein